MKRVVFIFPRDEHKDTLYGTGHWSFGQAKEVDELTAARLLRHPDTYREAGHEDAEPTETIEVGPPEKKTQEDEDRERVQDVLDSLRTMDKESLRLFSERNFQLKIDGRKSEESIRSDVERMIHQYGMPE